MDNQSPKLNYSIAKVMLAFESVQTSDEITKLPSFIDFASDLNSIYPDYVQILNRDIYGIELPNLNNLIIFETTIWMDNRLMDGSKFSQEINDLKAKWLKLFIDFFEANSINMKPINILLG